MLGARSRLGTRGRPGAASEALPLGASPPTHTHRSPTARVSARQLAGPRRVAPDPGRGREEATSSPQPRSLRRRKARGAGSRGRACAAGCCGDAPRERALGGCPGDRAACPPRRRGAGSPAGLTLEVPSLAKLPPGSAWGGATPGQPRPATFGAERTPSGPSLKAGSPREGKGFAVRVSVRGLIRGF